MNIDEFSFEGPFSDPRQLPAEPGVYVPMDFRNGQYFVTDTGESIDLRGRVSTHDRAGCWRRNTQGQLLYYVLRMPRSTADQRRVVEKRIRDRYNPPCGEV